MSIRLHENTKQIGNCPRTIESSSFENEIQN